MRKSYPGREALLRAYIEARKNRASLSLFRLSMWEWEPEGGWLGGRRDDHLVFECLEVDRSRQAIAQLHRVHRELRRGIEGIA